MEFAKDELHIAQHLILACEAAGKFLGIEHFERMSQLAKYIKQAADETTKQIEAEQAAKESEVTNGDDHDHGLGANDRRSTHRRVGASASE